jgi:hypothetical protein
LGSVPRIRIRIRIRDKRYEDAVGHSDTIGEETDLSVSRYIYTITRRSSISTQITIQYRASIIHRIAFHEDTTDATYCMGIMALSPRSCHLCMSPSPSTDACAELGSIWVNRCLEGREGRMVAGMHAMLRLPARWGGEKVDRDHVTLRSLALEALSPCAGGFLGHSR